LEPYIIEEGCEVMSVYAPSGSGNVHVDAIMGGKKKMPPKQAAKKGMGFAAAAQAAGGGKKGAAIVAAASRNASPAAKKANPNLKKVAAKGKPMPKGMKNMKGGKGK
jgi:hypothetical protein